MNLRNVMDRLFRTLVFTVTLALPVSGWPVTLSDRPLFIEAAVDHNLMFVVDDSGSMDYEVLAPAVGSEGEHNDSYLFDPGGNSTYNDGDRLYSGWYDFERRYYYLRSAKYNLQFYDYTSEYIPWPDGSDYTYQNADITDAKLDPGFDNSEVYDLTREGELGFGAGDVPATFFVENTTARLVKATKNYESCPAGSDVYRGDQCRRCTASYGRYCYRYDYQPRPYTTGTDTVAQCDSITENYFNDWRNDDEGAFFFEDANGNQLDERDMGLAPDGSCIQRVELVEDNEDEVEAITGDSLAVQQQNFANWFSYYRRRHQVIRGAIGEAVKELENMRVGVFWINRRRDMSDHMFDVDTQRSAFLDEHYDRFVDGTYSGAGTPNREALQHAGKEFSDESVRGNLECRNNYALLFTDGFSYYANNLDAGNADKNAPAPFADSTHSNTLSDVAYYYFLGLRRSSGQTLSGGEMRLPEECGTNSETAIMDCNSDFHMNTFTVALGMEGEEYAGKGYSKVADAHNNPPDWSQSSIDSEGPSQIDDLYHAAVNGKGEYYNASSAVALVASLQSAVDNIQSQLGSGSNVSFNTGSLKEGGKIYSAQFTSREWTGTLKAQSIGTTGNVTGTVWDAAELLDGRDLSSDPRLILTTGQNSDGDSAGVSFEWANLTPRQQGDLKYGGNDSLGKSRLSFIRGEELAGQSDGNGGLLVEFRDRKSRMGAVVNSSPTFVGPPAKHWPEVDPFGATGKRYSDFRDAKESRRQMVYVGASDGMLHGFDADTGEEVMAYIPQFLFSDQAGDGLHELTGKSYEYRSYVDLPVNASDVFIDNEWRTVALSAARGSGRGVFALDVTDPTQFSSANADDIAMWEFSSDDDPRMGHLTSSVQMAMLKWGNGDYRWSAVFGNGYGDSVTNNGVFVLDIGKSSSESWIEGENYHFIELASGSGLSPVRLVDNINEQDEQSSDGIVDRLYAGDRSGRLWSVSLMNGTSSWGSVYGSSPLFTATNANGQVQPITSRPVVARHNDADNVSDPGLMVFFGTGQYLTQGDVNTTETQSFYSISDQTSGNLTRTNLTSRELLESNLSDIDFNQPSVDVRKTTGNDIDWQASKGWYVDFDTRSGERVVSAAQIEGDYVVFPTNIPAGGDPCGGGGSSFLMALPLDGVTNAKSVIDVNNDGKLNEDDSGWSGVGYGDGILTDISVIGNYAIGSSTNTEKPPFLTDFGGGAVGNSERIGWHEVLPE